MKILQLSPQFPFPPDDGGRIAIANLTKEFARAEHEVTLFCLGNKPPLPTELHEAKRYANIILCNHSTDNTFLRKVAAGLLPISIYMQKHIGSQVLKDLTNLMKHEKFDVIHADHSCMAPAALFAKQIAANSSQNPPIGLRLHNVEWVIWQRYADELPPKSMKHWYIARQAKFLHEAEKQYYPQMDVCFAVSEKDREEALKLSSSANVVIAPHGITPDDWKLDESIKRNEKEIIIATTYKWVHNVEGVRWFIENVLPIVQEEIPEAHLTLIGKNPPDFFKQWSKYGVDVVGYVDKIQPYMNHASVYIAPLFVGSGVRIKILEAMAMALPVVATPIAREGIIGGESEGLFTAENAEEFARSVIYLLENPKEARTAGLAARAYTFENYTWKSSANTMLETYRRLIDN
ncbi:MAG: glycosyltransferase [Ignavibacteriae bacterium]|nr:glycosyltransferase [Ignavibacteriota bacterium]